ncbi:uncharacterized protein LOC126849264 [Cataglyphis hispanica]|uniref:uncharacterized protein LOC126849264 n=1 Tax=Cataglyphis hispanica TaxID=1086592 RepID=UPI00217FB808|nr:uncharacterized protein LOC126849264 [Cataglyphis hispanica]
MPREIYTATTSPYDITSPFSLPLQSVLIAQDIAEEMERKIIMTRSVENILLIFCLLVALIIVVTAYDPDDKSLKDILLPEGQFEAFYLKDTQDEEQNAVRPPHLHGSFHQYRNPALVDAPNSAAYGFRFDGKRRFNFS